MAKPQTKLPEICGQAFVSAREALGLSVQDVSRKSCFSVRQIEQIESGESSSFYGAQNKVTAAKKVAGLLKLKEEDAFNFGTEPQGKQSESETIAEETQELAMQSSASEEKQARSVKGPKSSEFSSLNEIQKPIPFSQPSGNHSPSKNPKKKIFLLLGIAAALVFSIVNLRSLFFPEPVKEEIVVIEEVSPTPPSTEAPAESKPVPAITSEPVTAAPLAVAAASSECPSADAAAINYRPDAPKKAGDMVYLQSKTAQTVCVIDASGKTQNKTLEPGVGVSIYGKPPLKVLTSGLSQVDIYYQGAKVRLANTTAKTINLESAEIVQPLTPTDSQLR
ncbi:helix-turn-helix domain-containing protein [Polynucleobacter sp. TSB-Sco08W16]|uniref:helix-turn-helix domain-containing protein n=1 Tax=Polynucleobacter sp. TSB-Sco08W16 TaxID=1758374 RepID=UPI001BFD113A|nr:helix-turn-helix domain-containing protein [Polynucleobacter sp. TSB-Sco08W16]QWD74833.1 helix-turn-helix domain-containing protein [Polynucleobacter sp. TSB-Sco08W16]